MFTANQTITAANLYVGVDVYEKGRTTPMGHWIDVAYSAGNFAATTGNWTVDAGDVETYAYALVGRTMTFTWRFLTHNDQCNAEDFILCHSRWIHSVQEMLRHVLVCHRWYLGDW